VGKRIFGGSGEKELFGLPSGPKTDDKAGIMSIMLKRYETCPCSTQSSMILWFIYQTKWNLLSVLFLRKRVRLLWIAALNQKKNRTDMNQIPGDFSIYNAIEVSGKPSNLRMI